MGEEEKADELYDRALAISAETENLRSRGWTLSNKALLRLKRGEAEQADSLYKDALQLFREVNDARMTAITLGATGYTRYLTGDIEGSIEDLKDALQMAEAMKLPSKNFEDTLLKHHEEILRDHPDISVPDLPDHWTCSP